MSHVESEEALRLYGQRMKGEETFRAQISPLAQFAPHLYNRQ
jgi:hypothetical protein